MKKSDFFEIDLSSTGLEGTHCAKRYHVGEIKALAKKLANKDYGLDRMMLLEKNIIGIIALAVGSSKTELKKARTDKNPANIDEVVAIFEHHLDMPKDNPRRLDSVQILFIIVDFLSNVERSASANYKSNQQAKVFKGTIKKFHDERLRKIQIKEVMLEEFSGPDQHRPDGILEIPGGTPILIYLRCGSGAGGSQGDRRTSFTSLPSEFPKYKFLFLWDGTEVVDNLVDQVNSTFPGRAYITRTKNFDEQRLRELYDSELAVLT